MKHRPWKWALGIAAGMALAVGGLYWSAHQRATAVFERHDALVKEAIAAIRARPSRHPCLYEPAQPGDGWAAYLTALSGFKAIPDGEADEIPAINGDPEFRPDPEKLKAIFQRYGSLVEELRKSNRLARFVPIYPYEAGLALERSNLAGAMRSARFLFGLAAYSHKEGQEAAALEAILLGIAVGHDTARSGPIVNFLVMLVCEDIEEEAMREILPEHSFEAAELESFARKFDRLWDARPEIVDAFVVEDAILRRSLVDLGMSRAIEDSSLYVEMVFPERTWRYLFSKRFAYAGALGELEQVFRKLQAVAPLAPHLRFAAADKIGQSLRLSKNLVVLSQGPILSRVYYRDSVSRLSGTLMRVSTAIAWHEAERGLLPENLEALVPRYLPRVPSCPLTGKPLEYRDGRVWSVGRNGIDDGGTPGNNNDPDDEDGDVVWTVKRK